MEKDYCDGCAELVDEKSLRICLGCEDLFCPECMDEGEDYCHECENAGYE